MPTAATTSLTRDVMTDPQVSPQAREPLRGAPELSVVVPAFNEHGNIPILFERLAATLQGISWEVIVVDDDSPDRTAEVAKAIGSGDSRVRCIRRIGRRGLAGAC